MIDTTDLRIEELIEYVIVNGKNQVVKDRFYSKEEAETWMEEVYGVEKEKVIESIKSESEKKMDKSSVLSERQEKEKVLSAEIVIHGTKEKPYYEIEYYDLDGECHIGYSSYDINFVYEWLESCFEVVPQFDNSKKKRGESEILKEAWEEIEIITNSNINELCSQNRYSDAKKLEDNRDIVKTALKLAGYKLGDEK